MFLYCSYIVCIGKVAAEKFSGREIGKAGRIEKAERARKAGRNGKAEKAGRNGRNGGCGNN